MFAFGVSLVLSAACSREPTRTAERDTASRSYRGAEDAQPRTPTTSSVVLSDCMDVVTRSAGPCPKPGERPRAEATRLTCTAEPDAADLFGLPILRARLSLAAGGQPLAGQLVRWELPAVLHGVGGRPDATTNAEGIASLGVAAAPGPVAVSAVIVARFTDPPPYTGRYNTLGDAECSVCVQLQRTG